ncbi:MAG: Fe-S cluster assembly ATPase SufC [Waddliaceae bacterium]
MLEINNLCVAIEGKSLLKGIDFTAQPGQIHAIMGPNGAGKSTLAKTIAGHPSYEVTKGEIVYKGKSMLALEPEERAHAGIFMSYQYPIEIPGVSNLQFLHLACNSLRKAREEEELSLTDFEQLLDEKMAMMEIKPEFKTRDLNEGFSGGEKKRNEILQMAVLRPDLAILDETDSGLDIDAMRIVSKGVNRLMRDDMSLILITHYQRLLEYIRPDYVHVMIDGRIVQSGGPDLALELEDKGYDWLNGEKRP